MIKIHPLCAALALLLAGSAAAETVYRHVDADGNVSFSSKPPKSGEKAEAVEIDTNRNVIAPESTPTTERLEAAERERYWQQKQAETQKQQESNAQVQAAEAQLRQAREAQQAGQALQPGDLIGKQGGGTRPSAQRNERLQRLDAELKAAEENLERARRSQ